MLDAMLTIANNHTIQYRIFPSDRGVKLSFWEPAHSNEYRPQPYTFMVNYQLKSVEEARDVLQQYLTLSGAGLLKTVTLPVHGKIKVLPHATWSASQSAQIEAVPIGA